MDSPCIKQTVCKVLKIFQYGKYLVAYVLNKLFVEQGRRRLFKSGPAEEAIECGRHKRGEQERGLLPLSLGEFEGHPEIFFNFERFYVRF